MIEYKTDLFVVIIDLSNIGQWGTLLANSHKLRKKVFIDELQWASAETDGVYEYDQFDNLGVSKYVVVTRDGITPLSMARVTPTNNFYMIESIAHRIPEFKAIKSENVWELRRLVMPDFDKLADKIEALKVLERGLSAFATKTKITSFLCWASKETSRLIKTSASSMEELARLNDDEGNETTIIVFGFDNIPSQSDAISDEVSKFGQELGTTKTKLKRQTQ